MLAACLSHDMTCGRRYCRGVVTLSQIERKSPTNVNTEAWDFNDLVYLSVAQIWLISLNVTTPAGQRQLCLAHPLLLEPLLTMFSVHCGPQDQ
jgi:hypothetical protein